MPTTYGISLRRLVLYGLFMATVLTVVHYLCRVFTDALRDDAMMTGIVLMLLMVVGTMLPLLKYHRRCPPTWHTKLRTAHIACGVAGISVFIGHVRHFPPGGGFEMTLTTLYVVSVLTGLLGGWFSVILPYRLERHGRWIPFRAAHSYCRNIREHAEEEVLQVVRLSDSSMIGDFFARHLQPFLARPGNLLVHCLGLDQRYRKPFTAIEGLRQNPKLRDSERKALTKLEQYAHQKDQLDRLYTLHYLSGGWKIIHIVSAILVLVLSVVHGLQVLAFAGGLW